MGLLIYLDDLKGSSVVARESANSFKDKLAHATKKAQQDKILQNELPPAKPAEPEVLTLQGWHKSPLVIIRPLERIIYFVEQPDRELEEMMKQQKEVAEQRREMMQKKNLIKPH